MLHETLIGLHFAHVLSEYLESVAELDSFIGDEVCQNEGGASALALDRVDQDLASAVQRLVDESICDAEVLLGIFLRLVVQLQVEIFEVAVALRVRLAGDVQNMRDAGLDQLARLEGALEGAHVDT